MQNLRISLLISLGKICDYNCTIVLDNKKLYAIKSKNIKIDLNDNDIIMRGTRNHRDGLYDIPIEKTEMQENNYLTPELHTIPSLNLIKSQPLISVTKNYKSIFYTKKQKPTVNNIPIRKFNNIVEPIIRRINSKF